ncbi:hypothetical protein HZA56_12600 [Candidatus Poribacteria bacterium]|nr:hypothetical protein [Candidatus Poribacteria bacterium]
MKQHEAVIKVMEENGGFATLGFLNQEVMKVPDVKWGTKTPFASIRRIVQDNRFFFKVKPGLWALNSHEGKLPFEPVEDTQGFQPRKDEFNHTYYQGLLVEIGNLKKYQTSVPNQDKNKDFLGRRLGDISSVREFYKFGYDHIVAIAQRVDVTWFNERKMPSKLFEVEHLSDIQNSLLKFSELQDYFSEFFIVANIVRKAEFEKKLARTAFAPVQRRVRFLSYEKLSEWHSRTYEIVMVEENLAP